MPSLVRDPPLKESVFTRDGVWQILRGMECAFILMDLDQRLLFFTPKAQALLSLEEGDLDHPLSEARLKTWGEGLGLEVEKALVLRTPIVTALTLGQASYNRTLSPIGLNKEGAIQGFLITFTKPDAPENCSGETHVPLASIESLIHDLRQPLQSMALLQGLLSLSAPTEAQEAILDRLAGSLDMMTGLLNEWIGTHGVNEGLTGPKALDERSPHHPSAPAPDKDPDQDQDQAPAQDQAQGDQAKIIIIEDDPEVLSLLTTSLEDQGHGLITGLNAAQILSQLDGGCGPVLMIIADYNLQGGINGLAALDLIRRRLGVGVPGLILTADMSSQTQKAIAQFDCSLEPKPITPKALLAWVEKARLQGHEASLKPLPIDQRASHLSPKANKASLGHVYIVDDDPLICQSLSAVLEFEGYRATSFLDSEHFLAGFDETEEACLLVDAYLPGLDGLGLLHKLRQEAIDLPVIMITGHADVGMAVTAMKDGALDFLEKPISPKALIERIKSALSLGHDSHERHQFQLHSAARLKGLTLRHRDVLSRILEGEPSKNIAADLGISQRTVENHRAAIMARTQTKSLPALARLVLAAEAISLPHLALDEPKDHELR